MKTKTEDEALFVDQDSLNELSAMTASAEPPPGASAENLFQVQHDLSLALSQASGMQDVLSCLLDEALRIEGIDAGVMYLRNQDTGALNLEEHRGLSNAFIQNVSVYPAGSDQADLAERGEPVFYDVRQPDSRLGEIYVNEDLMALAICPMKQEDRVVGVLKLASHTQREFSAMTRDTLDALACMGGGAVVRATAEAALHVAEDQLRLSEKMRVIGQLASGIAHDFNNQLTGIIGFAEIMLEQIQDDDDLTHYAEKILQGTEHAAELTKQMLAFTRKGDCLCTEVNLHESIDEVIQLLERTIDKRVRVTRQFNAQPPVTMGDKKQIQNALFNLALNASEAMPDGGGLTFATDVVELDQAFCDQGLTDIRPGSYLQIKVVDTGIGLDPEIREKMFEPFFTTKDPDQGTGMGLAAVLAAVKNHHGAVHMSSQPGQGTTMELYFPASRRCVKTGPNETEDSGSDVQAAHILLVDDEKLVCDVARHMLRGLGYRVSVSYGGVDAIQLYRSMWSEIDLVILDMMMPDLNGEDVLQAMQEINPDLAALLSTGSCINQEAKVFLKNGVKGILQKPFVKDELSQIIKRVLNAGSE